MGGSEGQDRQHQDDSRYAVDGNRRWIALLCLLALPSLVDCGGAIRRRTGIGQVLTTEGVPLPLAKVSARAHGRTIATWTTNTRGEFLWCGLPEGPIDLVGDADYAAPASLDGSWRGALTGVQPRPGERLLVRLHRVVSRTLKLRVMSEDGAVPHVRVSLELHGAVLQHQMADRAGLVRFDRLEDRNYDIHVERYAEFCAAFFTHMPGEEEYELPLERGQWMMFQVVDATGAPVDEARLSAVRPAYSNSEVPTVRVEEGGAKLFVPKSWSPLTLLVEYTHGGDSGQVEREIPSSQEADAFTITVEEAASNVRGNRK